MSRLRNLAVASLAILIAACGDIANPAAMDQSAMFAQGGRGGNNNNTAQDSTATPGSQAPNFLQFVEGSPPLTTYDTTFIAHQGWKQSFVIFHEDYNYFMVLDVPGTAQFVDGLGQPVPYGTPVPITVHVDDEDVSFEFGPHGSYFTGKRPVVLWIYLKYVDVANAAGDPAIWYQPDSEADWSALPTNADKAGNWLKVELRHFSNYAIAW